jgi:hypothetical protein
MRQHPDLRLAAALIAVLAPLSTAQAKPARRGHIVCKPAASVAGYVFDRLTVDYALTPIETVGDDLHASVAGTYKLQSCYWERHGTISGTMTPKVWYGGAFDVSLAKGGANDADARFLVFRDQGSAVVYLSLESTALECTGTP